MCGIVGIINNASNGFNHAELDVFRDLLVCDSVRGEDSTGVFGVNKYGNTDYLKLATHPYNLIKSKAYENWRGKQFAAGRVVVGHNRKATSGSITNANAHPFVFGPVVLVHNGAFDNFKSLLSQKEREKHQVDVDSHAAAVLLARHKPADIVPQMRGAFAMVWYNINEKRLYFVRNDQRPLAFTKFRGNLLFASEAPMLDWIIRRKIYNSTETFQIQTLKAGLILSADINDKEMEWDQHEISPDSPKQVFLPRPQEAAANSATSGMGAVQRDVTLEVTIPEEYEFNIHYGYDEPVDVDFSPFLRIAWEITDYKKVREEANCKTWIAWGKALESDLIEINAHFLVDEKEMERIAYSKDCLLSLVRRVKHEKIQKDGAEVVKTVVVVLGSSTTPITLVEPKGSGKIWKDHYDEMRDCMTCNCGTHLVDLKEPDVMEALWIQNLDDPKRGFHKPICDWCVNSEPQGENAEENPNPTLSPDE